MTDKQVDWRMAIADGYRLVGGLAAILILIENFVLQAEDLTIVRLTAWTLLCFWAAVRIDLGVTRALLKEALEGWKANQVQLMLANAAMKRHEDAHVAAGD